MTVEKNSGKVYCPDQGSNHGPLDWKSSALSAALTCQDHAAVKLLFIQQHKLFMFALLCIFWFQVPVWSVLSTLTVPTGLQKAGPSGSCGLKLNMDVNLFRQEHHFQASKNALNYTHLFIHINECLKTPSQVLPHAIPFCSFIRWNCSLLLFVVLGVILNSRNATTCQTSQGAPQFL